MKITRRFLALVLCLTLFIIPLPFSVHAQENCDDMIMLLSDYSETLDCPRCGGLYVVSLTGTTYTAPIGTYDKCIGSYYYAVRMECVDCHYQETKYHVLYAVSQHPTLIYGTIVNEHGNPVTGWHCNVCGYCRLE